MTAHIDASRSRSLTTFAFALALAGCGGSQVAAPPPVAPVVEPTPAPAPAPTPPADPPAAELRDNQVHINQMVEFRENSEALHERSTEILTRVVELLHAHPEVHHLRIEGNTDDLGNAEHNLHLSEERARSVAHFLHEHGVTITVDTVGHGATQPLCHEDTDPCRWRNRRVEFFVIP